MYSHISQIFLLLKTQGYYNKFDSMKSLGVHYWCVKIPQCGIQSMEYNISRFMSKIQIAPVTTCYNRNKPLGAPAAVKLMYSIKNIPKCFQQCAPASVMIRILKICVFVTMWCLVHGKKVTGKKVTGKKVTVSGRKKSNRKKSNRKESNRKESNSGQVRIQVLGK